MNFPPEYVEAAYLSSLAEYVERHVAERFVGEEKSPLICEQVPSSAREIPQSAIHHFLCLMRDLQKQAQIKMDSYEMRKRGETGYSIGVDADGNLRVSPEQPEQPQRSVRSVRRR